MQTGGKKMMRKKTKQFTFDEKELEADLLRSARAVGVSVGVAEIIVAEIIKKVKARIAKRAVLTVDDLNRFIADEAERYNKDLAYVYKNRGKII